MGLPRANYQLAEKGKAAFLGTEFILFCIRATFGCTRHYCGPRHFFGQTTFVCNSFPEESIRLVFVLSSFFVLAIGIEGFRLFCVKVMTCTTQLYDTIYHLTSRCYSRSCGYMREQVVSYNALSFNGHMCLQRRDN